MTTRRDDGIVGGEVKKGSYEQLAGTRVELLRWAFLFWVGQLVSVAGVVALMLRGAR